MDNDTQQTITEQSPIPPVLKKSNRKLWVTAGIVLAVVCLCSILCLVLLVTGFGKAMVERAPLEATLDTFMNDMEAKDVESAFALLSPRAQRHIAIDDLKKLDENNNYVMFEGYENVSLQHLSLSNMVNTNPDMPQGSVANVTAIVLYENDFQGELTATLEKVDGTWMFFNFHIVVPPDKLKP